MIEDYPRRAHLEFYRAYPSPFYSLTFELEATALRRRLKGAGWSTYAGFCWAFHRALQGLPAFRVRLRGDDVVVYDELQLGMTVPAPRGCFSFLTVPWDGEAGVFLPRAGEAMRAAAAAVDLTGGGAEPDFAYYTALPRVPFTGFTHATLADREAGQPQVAFGRMREAAERVTVPVGVQVNHVYIDGADLGDLYEAVSESFARAW